MQQDEQFIGDVYELSAHEAPQSFRQKALQHLLTTMNANGAVWASGPMELRELERISCAGLPETFVKKLASYTAENPIMSELFRAQGKPVDMRDAVDDKTFFDSLFYHECFEPYQIHRVLSSLKIDANTQVFTLLSLYRVDEAAVFTDAEKQRQQRFLYHLHRCDQACLQSSVIHHSTEGLLAELSEREQQVVAELMKNQTMKQIAKQLSLAPSTVANHLYRIYQKLNVNGKAELVAYLEQIE